MHWGDEATLDVLRLLLRRIESVPVLVFVTYRDDELDRAHPLRLVLGELPWGAAERLAITPLSAASVTELARPLGIDPAELYRKTAGNPFFVTEALAAGTDGVPDTVRDAVLARAARLPARARRLLDAVAVLQPQAELWVLGAVAPHGPDDLERCVGSGMLVARGPTVGFRHELAREALEQTLNPTQALRLHRAALQALSNPPDGVLDLARLAHHAEAASDREAVLRFAPAAGEKAAAVGSHREAAAQFSRALRFADEAGLDTRAALLDRHAYECYVTGDFDAALASGELALECHRKLGQRPEEGDALRSLSRLLRYVGRLDKAAEAGRRAVEVLESIGPGHELAMAYCNLSHLYMSVEEVEGTLLWGSRALELARTIGDLEAELYALINIGVIELLSGSPQAVEKLEHCLQRASEAGLEEHAGRAYVSLTWWGARSRSYAAAHRYVEPGLDYCAEHGLDLWRPYLLAYRARSQMAAGAWDEAVESAGLVLRDPHTSPVARVTALAVTGLIRARRGDPDARPPLEEAWAMAEATGELQRIEPAAVARAEAAWLEDRPEAIVAATDSALKLALKRNSPWVVGELTCWRRRAGLDEEVPAIAPEPFAAQLAGDWSRAADLWSALGCDYEAALALADSGDHEAMRQALAEFQRLGAKPAAALTARWLRERGARGLPRGPRPSTRRNPARLTAREFEVLALVARGQRNAEIAQRLFLTEKTIDHHVSAILGKLGIRSRADAAAAARRLGIELPA
jgi:DNA-binding CsgD family transcriptional regulator